MSSSLSESDFLRIEVAYLQTQVLTLRHDLVCVKRKLTDNSVHALLRECVEFDSLQAEFALLRKHLSGTRCELARVKHQLAEATVRVNK